MTGETATAIVARLETLYEAAVANLRRALSAFIADGTRPDPAARATGAFAYPELRVRYSGETAARTRFSRSYGRLVAPGEYRISVTRPALFADYLQEQIGLLVDAYGVEVEAVVGWQEIPFPYVLDAGHSIALDNVSAEELARWFPATELAQIGDEVADGVWRQGSEARPLALFDGLRVDYSLARLRHYSGTPVEHVQRYILFTNYHRYVDEFVRYACTQLKEGGPYTALSGAGGLYVTPANADPDRSTLR